ncbi:MAG TPA: acetoacetate--CoA ligase [Acidimicrobiales bacterium]|jgi:acetoacetyl-CoA synthetase|nr:acetoacetate--CoA ligase [Acidimicrobiales bacterium]
MTAEGDVLWEPSKERIDGARISEFARFAGAPGDYDVLWRWSVEDLRRFWGALTDWAGIRWTTPPTDVLADRSMPGARWFPDGRVNYAEHALFPLGQVSDASPAVIFVREDGHERTLTWTELRAEVAAVRTSLKTMGVTNGDRVVAFLPNAPEALIAMLATVSLGAAWSSCSPDFGVRAAADRFAQVEPVVLFAVDGYRYGGRSFDILDHVEELRSALPTLQVTVLVPYLDDGAELAGSRSWQQINTVDAEPLEFEPVPFDWPMWILYSSGTTGLPKPIVHGHGGILVEHVKQLALHLDLGPQDRFFWFSTTGWMMWNLLVSGLVLGSTVVLYDGNPMHSGPDALWRMAEAHRITCFGVSAPFIQACQREGIEPSALGLEHLRTVGSTGAPLSPEGFAWVYGAVKQDVMLSSLSGGTDVCTAFVGGAPNLPVRAGIIPCRLLGCAVASFDEAGQPVTGQVGELVITEPMPSMPVAFWGDDDGSRLRDAYFATYAGVWDHGDWIRIDADGSCVIYGRSDATLNRGGVRMGTAEFYRVVEDVAGVEDSLVIDTSAAGVEGRLLLFVVPSEGADFTDLESRLRSTLRSQLSPRHVPDAITAIAEVPRTLNGKKCEVPVKRVLAGVPLEKAISLGAVANPEAMDAFRATEAP